MRESKKGTKSEGREKKESNVETRFALTKHKTE